MRTLGGAFGANVSVANSASSESASPTSSSATAVPAIVASITGRRPTRSESRPQSGWNTNWAAG